MLRQELTRWLGTSSIVHEETHQPLLSILSAVVETVVNLRSQGHKVVLVSSGAIGVGLRTMDIPQRPKSLSKKQVCPQAERPLGSALKLYFRLSLPSDRVD